MNIDRLIKKVVDQALLCYDADTNPGQFSKRLIQIMKLQIYQKYMDYPEGNDEYPECESEMYINSDRYIQSINGVHVTVIHDLDQKITDEGCYHAPQDLYYVILKNKYGSMIGSF